MEKYGKYGKAAICATELIRTGKCDNPREAWNIACKEQFLPHQETSIKKGCPKGAYLGLCEEGKIEDVPEGKYTTSEKNKRYALIALDILQSSPRLAKEKLWGKVLERAETEIRHNNQLDVVLALFEAGLINKVRAT